MKNAYDVLGIPADASSEQIDAAYRELSRKYAGNQKKIDELNAAYDSIVMNSRASFKNEYYDYSDIRAKIRNRRFEDAEILLDGIPESARDAEWHYLKGVIYQKRGWLEEAAHNFARASSMDPSNNTYRAAYKQINNSRTGGFRTERRPVGRTSSCSACDMCCGLLCADSCCECLGGDCISCC